MIRQTFIKASTRISANSLRVPATISTYRSYSVVDKTKDILNKVNLKTGQVLADGLEATEHAVENVQAMPKKAGQLFKDGMDQAEALAEGSTPEEKLHRVKNVQRSAAEGAKETADEAAGKAKGKAYEAKETIDNAAETTKGKAYETAESAKQKTRQATSWAQEELDPIRSKAEEISENIKNKASKATASIKSTASEAVKKAGQTIEENEPEPNQYNQNVKQNYKGYDSLKDKGSKVEGEQNRPDDGF
ncbi:uncharacterized protein J8A68_002518 [[Candida] subhashii]|uniref:Uncharacterized protein n=1 Tax=[Candida] subhashii TaxID=561895 RepID=A0A8J5QJ13_9ASCO|nr:uncharacterized protein J8A68_002518 [[Candida] subhashii]KAG7663957.1 hypothetical protein J8A68_002518 [[Candida] subhashii]